ncbi:MAG: 50S ribosomal protein L17 [Candidatus Pacebacteria bacterium]|nr:50S ribosomal protein L17 [Candidatus Paceibacterota bacterium]
MLHSNKKKQLGRGRNQRNALVKTLAVSLIKNEKIVTTETKAKVLKSFVEKLITKGKAGTLNSQRLIAGSIGATMAKKICKEISPKYLERKGGYTRVTKIKTRISDGAKMAQIEFV